VIASFRSKALERFWWKGETRRVDSRHVGRLRILLTHLEAIENPQEMNQQGFGFHRLAGDQAGRYAVKVDKNWRVTFGWIGDSAEAVNVDYEDYH
jgi:proteic killer suppression protein